MTLALRCFFFLLWLSCMVKADISLIIQQHTFDISSDLRDTSKSEDQPTQATCIGESGLSVKNLSMADVTTFSEHSLPECVRFCLANHPDKSHVLISYYDKTIFGDVFKCLCADTFAISLAPSLSEIECRRMCPSSNYRCGDANAKALSVYCLQRSCSQTLPICQIRVPHDAQGCIGGDSIDWKYAHNVRNFSAEKDNDLACVWECHDHHPRSMYSLTRVIDNLITCSCGYPKAFMPEKMVQMEFCKMLPKSNPYYTVKCITDLDEHAAGEVDPGNQCHDILPMGCIYEELLVGNPVIDISNFDGGPDPESCHLACSSVFSGTKVNHVGIRWIGGQRLMRCACLEQDSWNSSLVGPSSACNIECEPKGTGLTCGGPAAGSDDFPAVTVYCLQTGDSSGEKAEGNKKTQRPLLKEIQLAVAKENVNVDIAVALLTLLCVILLSIVTYLCFSRGISSLSRNIM